MDENRTSEIIHREKRQFGPIERAMKDLQRSQSNYLLKFWLNSPGIRWREDKWLLANDDEGEEASGGSWLRRLLVPANF